MSASAAIIGKGTTVSYSATIGGTYVALSEVVDAPLPEIEMPEADVTHYLSPNATMEETPGQWTKPGEMALMLNYVKTSTTLLLGTLYGVSMFYKLTLPDGSVWGGPGYIKKLGGTVANKEAIRTLATLKQIGPWTFTPAA